MDFAARPAWRCQCGTLLLAAGGAVAALAVIARGPIPRLGSAGHLAVAGGLAGLSALAVLVAAYRRYRYGYRIGDNVIEARKGILTRKVDALHLNDLRHVEVNQGIRQRILGVGTIRFASAGTDRPEIVFRGMLHPERLRRKLQQYLESSGGGNPSSTETSASGRRSSEERDRIVCSRCGERLKASANFCSQCGEAV